MDRIAFEKWLKVIKKYNSATCKARTGNILRIEKYYGNLDEIYSNDKCQSLLEDFTGYTVKDNASNVPPEQKVPIDGNKYTGTQTLRSTLKLFIEFKENKIIEEIKTMPDIDPDKHDGSYELVRENYPRLK